MQMLSPARINHRVIKTQPFSSHFFILGQYSYKFLVFSMRSNRKHFKIKTLELFIKNTQTNNITKKKYKVLNMMQRNILI